MNIEATERAEHTAALREMMQNCVLKGPIL